MTTLVIHPDDRSTDFLKPIYSKIPNSLVITGGYTKEELKQMVIDSEEVILCGHGSQNGLFSVGAFGSSDFIDYIIDGTFAPLLEKKNKVVTIWCYARSYIDSFGLQQAYYSDMFISEVSESVFCGLRGVTQEQVNESNYCFSNCLQALVHLTPNEIHTNMQQSAYALLANSNPVAAYNFSRLGASVLQHCDKLG